MNTRRDSCRPCLPPIANLGAELLRCPSLRYDRGAQTLSATQGQCTAGPRAPSRRHAPVRRTCSAISRRKRRARPRNSASWRRSAASAYGRIYRLCSAIVPRSRALVRPTSRMTCRLWHCTRCAHCTHCTRCTLRIGALLIRWKLSLPLHSHNFLPNSNLAMQALAELINAHSSHPPRLFLAEYLVLLGDARLCSVQRPPERPSTTQVRARPTLRLANPALTAHALRPRLLPSFTPSPTPAPTSARAPMPAPTRRVQPSGWRWAAARGSARSTR